MSDLSAGITGSLSRDGLGGMRADLPMGGFKLTNVATGTLPTDGVNLEQISGIGAPVGSVFDYAGLTAPNGFMLLYGQAISRVTYAALFAIIGTTYGNGDGTTTFNLPDARGRTVAGKDDMGGSGAGRLAGYAGTTIGAGFGTADHVLTTPQMPSHAHGVTDPGHLHTYTGPTTAGGGIGAGGGLSQITTGTDSAVTGISIQSTGGGGAHPNVQPTLILNKIMKVL